MCTLTWILDDEGYHLFASRDELRTRGPALPPRVLPFSGTRGVAPTDADAGGTWIGVNEYGVALCLLNGRSRHAERDAFRSRGLLVRDLLGATTPANVAEALRDEALDAYRGFSLVVFAPGRSPVVHAWDGRTLGTSSAGEIPLVSSSRDAEAAAVVRQTALRRLGGPQQAPTVTALLGYHRSHEPEPGPLSVCMHRDDARTVSLSHVHVDAERVAFRYADGPPCRHPLGPALTLDRP